LSACDLQVSEGGGERRAGQGIDLLAVEELIMFEHAEDGVEEQGSAEVAAVWLPLRFFLGKWRFAEAGVRPIMGGMSRLRRLVVSGR
jgi:hypothetical protein